MLGFAAPPIFFAKNDAALSPNMTEPIKDRLSVWAEARYSNQTTRRNNLDWLRALFHKMKLTPEKAVEQARQDPVEYSFAMKAASLRLAPSTRWHAVRAHRFYMEANAVKLPEDKVTKPQTKKDDAEFTWSQAERIENAARPPYNLVFYLMRSLGWGIHEFLAFNTQANWEKVKARLAENPKPEYVRITRAYRKSNSLPFYTLIPTPVLERVIKETRGQIPIRNAWNKPLSAATFQEYQASRAAIWAAFKSAISRAGLKQLSSITDHNLRDMFRSHAEHKGVNPYVSEFAMGHTIDRLGYNKCWNDETWTWSELKKFYTE
jgi:integrase